MNLLICISFSTYKFKKRSHCNKWIKDNNIEGKLIEYLIDQGYHKYFFNTLQHNIYRYCYQFPESGVNMKYIENYKSTQEQIFENMMKCHNREELIDFYDRINNYIDELK